VPSSADPLRGPDLEERVAALEAELRRGLRRLGPIVAAGLLLVLLAATWSGLWAQAPQGQLALVALLGAAPALVRIAPVRRAALWAALMALLAAVCVLGVAVGAGPVRVVRGDDDTWSALGDIIPEGLGNASSTPLPLLPDRPQALSALLLLILCGGAALIAWQAIVARRPLAAIIATAAGLAYRWTLVPPERPVLTGAVALVVALIVFRLAGPRRPGAMPAHGRAALLGGAIAALAILLSVGGDATPTSWWNWRDWDFGGGGAVSAINFRQSYGPLTYPDNPVVIARVEADEAIPLRAVTLESFDGLSFGQASSPQAVVATDGGIRLNPDRRGTGASVKQRITLRGVRTPWVLAGGRPITLGGIGRRVVTVLDDDSVRVEPSLAPATRYEVDTLVPKPRIRDLIDAAPYGDVAPELLTVVPGLGAGPVRVPVWRNREPRSESLDFGQYDGVYRLSRRVIGDARTAYEAVNRIEAFVRGSPYRYDDQTPRPTGSPDLVDFLLVGKRGYCQQFAGAMALMLRMNGIPARVVVGFTSDAGRITPDTSSYEILDRDAHSWVEVQFPGHGWLPFDPTPGRSVPNSTSVSSPSYTRDGVDIGIDPGISAAPVLPTRDPDLQRPEDAIPTSDSAPADGVDRRWLFTIPAVLLLAMCTPLGLKSARRLRRRRRGGERARVLGAARELESLLDDAGRPLHPSLTPSERVRVVWHDLGIDAERIYGLASAARFAPGEPSTGSGRAAWGELARIRRKLGWRRRARAGLSLRSLRGAADRRGGPLSLP
jgi:transglutaminase-like putative cysteine protease